MNSKGMIPLISNPTRITRKSSTLIDNIFTNDIKHDVNSGIVIEDISDHLPIYAVCNFEKLDTKGYTFHESRQIDDNT